LAREETVEAGGEDEDSDPEDTPVGEVGLEPVEVGRFGAVNALLFASIIESEESDVHRQPGEEATGGGQRLEPGEDLISGLRNGEEGEEGEAHSEEDGNIRQTLLRALGQDDRSLSSERQPIKDTGRSEQEGIASGERGGEDGCVNDVWKDLDSGIVEGNYVG